MGSMGVPGASRSSQQAAPRRSAGVYHYSRRKRRLSRFLIRLVGLAAILSLLFAGFRYGPFQPFEKLRTLWVTTAMTTLHHQYLAKWFFSDAEIQKILDSNQAENLGNSDPSSVSTHGISNNKGIELIDVSRNGFKGYLLKVNDPSRVKVAATRYLGEKGERSEEIANTNGAIAVINGGTFYDPQGTGSGGQPLGILVSDGKILYKDSGKESFDIIGMNEDNVLTLGHYTLAQIEKQGIRDAVTFSPFLIVNGKTAINQGDGGWGIAPRTAIGQTREGQILLLVIDGRQLGSLGASLKDVQDIMVEYGAYNAANLDGGASTILYYNGKLVNHPSSPYGERQIPSFFIVK